MIQNRMTAASRSLEVFPPENGCCFLQMCVLRS